MLVRSPGLRMLDEAQLRGALRRVAWLMRDLELSQPALLAAVYKRPWTLLAAAGDERDRDEEEAPHRPMGASEHPLGKS